MRTVTASPVPRQCPQYSYTFYPFVNDILLPGRVWGLELQSGRPDSWGCGRPLASGPPPCPPLCPLQADRQYDVPPHHRAHKQPKDGFLVEQVFSPHPYPASLKAHLKNNPLYTDMRLTELAEVKRGQPSWTIEEFARNAGDKGKLAALDLQVSLWRPRVEGVGGARPHGRTQERPRWPVPSDPPWNSEP